MKDIINKEENIRRIEFWAATAIFVFAIFFLITNPVQSNYNWTPNKVHFDKVNINYSYFENYFIPKFVNYCVIYLSFLLLNFYAIPKLIKKEALVRNILLVIGIIIFLGIVFGTTDTYLKTYLFFEYGDETYTRIFQNSFLYGFWLILVIGFYNVIKFTALYLLKHSDEIQSRYKFITPSIIITFVVWMLSIFLLLIGEAEGEGIIGWMFFSLTGIVVFYYAYARLIPDSLKKNKPIKSYFIRIFLILALAFLPVSLFAMTFTYDEEAAFLLGFFNSIFHLFLTAPLAWIIFKRQMKGNEEIFMLKKELGQSNASFDFLRSQINPHFLFNALNTIYGTAIQEKAERTSEGIEKLGDMMRFMLQENMQEKISLSREIEYLNNYIGLQKLRTDENPDVKIEAHIEEPVQPYQISPMLLIPFVENAFKHGISFRKTSHINVSLELKDNTLYFDVYNSRHEKPEQDPEKYKSGIGLVNVKQRLELLYKNKHELVIRETGKEYFVHLTLKLKK